MAELVPPHDADLERAVLSAMMLDEGIAVSVAGALEPDAFFVPAHRIIFEACAELLGQRVKVDAGMVGARLRTAGRLALVGVEYLAQVVDASPNHHNIDAHVAVVRDKARLRALQDRCRRLVAEAYGDVPDAQAFLDQAEQQIYQLRGGQAEPQSQWLREVTAEVVKEEMALASGERSDSIRWPFAALDRVVAPLEAGDLVIVAASTSVGKTAFACNVAERVASGLGSHEGDARPGVLLISCEMMNRQLARRLLASSLRVPVVAASRFGSSAAYWDRFVHGAAEIASLPIKLEERAAITLMQTRACVRRTAAELERAGQKLGLVIVDYVQIMGADKTIKSREQQVAELSRGLKQLAKEMRVPVIALAQLNRAADKREGRPILSDLRESGSLEQDADVVMFLHREKDPDKAEQLAGKHAQEQPCEVIVAKQRRGRLGVVQLAYDATCTRFDDMPADALA